MTPAVSIVVVDAHPLMRDGLRGALEREAGFQVVGEAGDGLSALTVVASQGPDVVILDSALPCLDTCEAVLRLRARHARLRILVSLGAGETFEVQEFIRAGANGVVARNTDAAEFVSAIKAVLIGGSYFSHALVGALFKRHPRAGAPANMLGLTAREVEILRLIGTGFSNKDIARRLDLSVRTVETHRLNIRKKTNASRFKDLLDVARRIDAATDATPGGGQPAAGRLHTGSPLVDPRGTTLARRPETQSAFQGR